MGPLNWRSLNRTLARVYLRQRQYAQALRHAERALHPRTPTDPPLTTIEQALRLVQQSQVLLAPGRTAAARPMLRQAQHIADSQQVPPFSFARHCQLHAAWARYYAATGKSRG